MSTNKLTPVMEQYLSMKAENPSAVLLFRLGDFYEIFFGDAVIASKALGLVLTKRGTDERGVDIPMCGIPWHASENYLGRLVKQGISVAIAEQMETPEEAKARGHKQIERRIVRVLTKGTLTDDNLLNPKKSNFLVAVVGADNIRPNPNRNAIFADGSDGRILSAPTLSIAAADISTGEFLAGEGGFDELVKLDPAEILYDEAFAETPDILRIRENFNTTPLHKRQYDNFELGERATSAPRSLGEGRAERMLMAYLRMTQRDSKIRLAPPKKIGAEDDKVMSVDSNSWRSLEIDAPLNPGGGTLLDIIDQTGTAAGGRLIRRMLRNLSADLELITARQAHIAHLVINRAVLRDISGLLSKVGDVGRCLSRLASNRGTPRDLTAVFEFLRLLPELKVAGLKLDEKLAARFHDMELFDGLAGELSMALSDSMPAFLNGGGVIKNGFSAELDSAREMAAGAKSTIATLQGEYVSLTGIAALKIKFNNIIGYYIEVAAKNSAPLMNPESGFIHRQTMSDNMRFVTVKLSELDKEIRSASDRAMAIEQGIISALIDGINSAAEGIIEVADLLAETDVFSALAIAADEWGWTAPKITKEPAFRVIGARHPVVEKRLRDMADSFVKNDCELNEKSVALLTGPNMSGKSTYLRQNALIIVLAHMGSFVPAERAEIGLADQLFSRVGASDNLASGQSTFMVEMSETANILNRATSKSFIIFDEIGRGTATFDGMAIAEAVLEYTNEIKPRCLFATHYHELTDTDFSNVKNLTVEVSEGADEIIFLHKIKPGVANHSYGIHVAKMAGMPEKVVRSAERILAALENRPPPVVDAPAARSDTDTQLSLF